eukprot:scaffold250902_cov19-Tisochrysis_lutea.AAC.1
MAAEQAAAAAEQERASQQADKLAQVLEGARGESVLIEELRREQARLRAEYDRMEDKLREMEEQMKAREAEAAKARGDAAALDDGLAPEMTSGTTVLKIEHCKCLNPSSSAATAAAVAGPIIAVSVIPTVLIKNVREAAIVGRGSLHAEWANQGTRPFAKVFYAWVFHINGVGSLKANVICCCQMVSLPCTRVEEGLSHA